MTVGRPPYDCFRMPVIWGQVRICSSVTPSRRKASEARSTTPLPGTLAFLSFDNRLFAETDPFLDRLVRRPLVFPDTVFFGRDAGDGDILGDFLGRIFLLVAILR